MSRRLLPVSACSLLLTILLGATSADASDKWAGIRMFSQGEVYRIATGDGSTGPLLVDARSDWEYEAGHIPGAINIPHKETWGRIAELEPYRERGIVYYCTKGGRATIASDGAKLERFPKIGVLYGSYEKWVARGLPTVTGPNPR